ncbi:hypothetical protein GOBAR_DD09042 [Gossypium barbadense]|nr:hypothetical protein GOBAR_DD09042 [Gossypium barbadense]
MRKNLKGLGGDTPPAAPPTPPPCSALLAALTPDSSADGGRWDVRGASGRAVGGYGGAEELPISVIAGDIVHDDNLAPKKPGCARFGTTIVSKEKNANQRCLILSDPCDCCSHPKNKLANDFIMVDRGHCKFTTKANNAQAAHASAVLIINNQKETYWRICTLLKVNPVSSTAELYKMLYSPKRPLDDIAEVFLWLMAIGTIICASYWSVWSARGAAIEQDKLLKDALDEIPESRHVGSGGVVDINTKWCRGRTFFHV